MEVRKKKKEEESISYSVSASRCIRFESTLHRETGSIPLEESWVEIELCLQRIDEHGTGCRAAW